jgi:polyhydroxybutyrate depolymerase
MEHLYHLSHFFEFLSGVYLGSAILIFIQHDIISEIYEPFMEKIDAIWGIKLLLADYTQVINNKKTGETKSIEFYNSKYFYPAFRFFDRYYYMILLRWRDLLKGWKEQESKFVMMKMFAPTYFLTGAYCLVLVLVSGYQYTGKDTICCDNIDPFFINFLALILLFQLLTLAIIPPLVGKVNYLYLIFIFLVAFGICFLCAYYLSPGHGIFFPAHWIANEDSLKTDAVIIALIPLLLILVMASIFLTIYVVITTSYSIAKMLFRKPVITELNLEIELIKPGTSLEIDGVTRKYIVHVPIYYSGEHMPLVMVFHPDGSNALSWMSVCGLNDTADQYKFIAVYPDGICKTTGYKGFGWNGGSRVPGGRKRRIAKVDDVSFVSKLLDVMERGYNIDTRRVFATGMSMGAMMVYRLASELSPRIAAIAPVAGCMGTDKISLERPVPIIHFHGMADQEVPYRGGRGIFDPTGTYLVSVDETMSIWSNANGCDPEPVIKEFKDNAWDTKKVIRKKYRSGNDKKKMVLYAIEGGGHTWPVRSEEKALRKSPKNISANELMWKFFEKHPML